MRQLQHFDLILSSVPVTNPPERHKEEHLGTPVSSSSAKPWKQV